MALSHLTKPEAAEASGHAPLLRLCGITKHFGGVRALAGADLEVKAPGEVHTLIGENGSGKSSLLGVLSGQLRPDSGRIELDGREVAFRTPMDALRQGIAMVSQEVAVAPSLSITENVLLGRLPGRRGWVDWQAARDLVRATLTGLGLATLADDLEQPVGGLRPDQRQMIEIARALTMKARILILDEPTSSLTDREIGQLFSALARLRGHGVAIVFVSHRLDEVFRISDAITVLRSGMTVASAPAHRFTPRSLVSAMIGADPGTGSASVTAHVSARPLLSVRGLSAARAFTDIDLDVAEGEIVGLCGLVGSGRGELLEALFGARTAAGEMTLAAQTYRPGTERDAITAGVGYLPPDRKTQGLVLPMSVADNLTLVADSSKLRFLPPDRRAQAAAFATATISVKLRATDADVPVRTLSGGNQQKVALAKWLAVAPRLLLLDEPTRGVDVSAKAEIHDRLRESAARGLSLLVSSSETPELLALCHRIVVMSRGRVVGTLDAATADEATLAGLAGGGTA